MRKGKILMPKYTFYHIDNKIIAVSTYAGKTVKGIAKCSPEDDFNVETGKSLAAARCNAKVAVKRVKNAQKEWNKAVQEHFKAERHMRKMAQYYTDAVKRSKEAQATVDSIIRILYPEN